MKLTAFEARNLRQVPEQLWMKYETLYTTDLDNVDTGYTSKVDVLYEDSEVVIMRYVEDDGTIHMLTIVPEKKEVA